MVHLSHAVTDGVGGVEMFANIYDLERDPPPQDVPPLPIPQDLSPNDLMRQGINRLPGRSWAAFVACWAEPRKRSDSDPRPGPRSVGRRGLRPVRRPGDEPRRGTVARAAAPQPVVAQRSDRYRVRRSAQGGQGGRRVDQRRLPGRAVRCPAALPRGQGRADRHAADGDPGQPALRQRSRRREPLRRGQPRRADRSRRSREADQEHSRPR